MELDSYWRAVLAVSSTIKAIFAGKPATGRPQDARAQAVWGGGDHDTRQGGGKFVYGGRKGRVCKLGAGQISRTQGRLGMKNN